jgi:hypothetical protein
VGMEEVEEAIDDAVANHFVERNKIFPDKV